jgi:hypothetical protein
VLAHQGGWDEILMVLVPMAVIAWLLWMARRRVERSSGDGPPSGEDTGHVGPE